MKNIAKILMVLALAFISYGVNAQNNAKKGSVHRFTMGSDDVLSSKYEWKVLKGGVVADPLEFKFVTSYNDLSAPATTDSWEVFIQFNGAVADVYTVQVQEKDETTECSDDTYNVKSTPVTIAANDFWGKLTWDVDATDSAGATVDCAIRDDGDNTTIGFTLTVNDDATLKNWNYTYALAVSNTDVIGDVIFGAPEAAVSVAGDLTTSSISTKQIVPTGEGYYYVWVKIIKLTDGFGTAYNEGHAETVAYTRAKLRKIPTEQTVQMAD